MQGTRHQERDENRSGDDSLSRRSKGISVSMSTTTLSLKGCKSSPHHPKCLLSLLPTFALLLNTLSMLFSSNIGSTFRKCAPMIYYILPDRRRLHRSRLLITAIPRHIVHA